MNPVRTRESCSGKSHLPDVSSLSPDTARWSPHASIILWHSNINIVTALRRLHDNPDNALGTEMPLWTSEVATNIRFLHTGHRLIGVVIGYSTVVEPGFSIVL